MEIVVRAVILFFFLWLITRLTGRTTIGELSAFQLVLFIVMGDLIQQSITQQDYSVIGGILVISTFALLTILLSWVGIRFPRMRGVTHGIPVVVVTDGEPDLEQMRTERLALDDLYQAARQQGIRRLSDIELGVLETNGRISFFARTQNNDTHPAVDPGTMV